MMTLLFCDQENEVIQGEWAEVKESNAKGSFSNYCRPKWLLEASAKEFSLV